MNQKNASSWRNRVCENCGKGFQIEAWRLKRAGSGRFCSAHCQRRSRWLPRETPTQETLKQVLEYNPETGLFTRLVDSTSRRHKAGEIAGTKTNGGYISIGMNGKIWLAHRLAWLYMTGEWPEADIDHINRCRDDNRWENLRQATRHENLANSMPKRGWSFHKSGKFLVTLVADGEQVYRELFDTEDEAADAYRRVHLEVHGEFSPFASRRQDA